MLSIKEELHKKIDLLNDVEQLTFLNETAEVYLTNANDSYDLTDDQLKDVEESMKQYRNGNYITNEQMNEKLKKWFIK